MSDQFLQIGAKLPSDPNVKVYGFGEHEHDSLVLDMNWQTLGMFASDHFPTPSTALYGTQPYYSVVEDAAGNTHSVLFLNSNAQDVQLTPAPGLVYRTIGNTSGLKVLSF